MKKEKLVVVLLLLLPLLSMCNQPVVRDVDFVELSDETVDFSDATSKYVISVKTNGSGWNFIKKGEWLIAKQNPDQLLLSAASNPSPEPRSAEILILSGRVNKKITVTQKGRALDFILSQREVTVNSTGTTFSIDVSTNAKTWIAKTDVDWLHLSPTYQIGRLHVEVDENPEYERRVAIISFSSEDFGKKEVTVIQSGKIYLLLPSFEFQADNFAIRQFEFKRGSIVRSAPDGIFNTTKWNFQPLSEVIEQVSYTVYQPDKNSEKEYYKHSYIIPYNSNLFQNKRELELAKRFLESNGFVAQNEGESFMNWQEHVEAIISIEGQSKITFNYRPEEPKDFRTILSFPKTHEQMSNVDELTAWEAQNNGELNEKMSNLSVSAKAQTYWYDVHGSGDLKGRVYTVKKGVISAWSYIYTNKNLALFDYGGTDFLTQNFINLMKKEGYVYRQEMDYNVFEFFNLEQKTLVYVRFLKFANYPTATLEFQIQKI